MLKNKAITERLENTLILVDIGNTHYHTYKDGLIEHFKKPKKFDEKIYYISVNEKKEKEFLKLNPHAIDLKPLAKFNTEYKNLGIDRIMACKPVRTGTVIDAGSAITIDSMKEGEHLGGIIMPGLHAFKEAFAKISDKLKIRFTNDFDIKKLPKNTNEALLYGSIGALVRTVSQLQPPYIFTGGDGEYLSRFMVSRYDEELVFKGMILTIKEQYESSAS